MIRTSWFVFGFFFYISSLAPFFGDVPNTKPDVVLWSQGKKFVLFSLKAYLDYLVMTDHEGVEDLFTLLVSGIMVLWATTRAASSFDLPKKWLDQENKQNSIQETFFPW